METSGNIIQDSFKSIASHAEGLFKDNGSRFIAHAWPVETVGQIKDIIDSIKKEYHDARHHCYAYRLGYKGDVYRANDDGEPSSSAGKQILYQIDSLRLSDILVVVVRYFGGIKLGIPGLIRAYRTSTADALSKCTIVEKVATNNYTLSFPYLSMNSVMRVLKDLSIAPKSQDFNEECSLTASVRLSLEKDFLKRMGDIEGCSIRESTENELNKQT